MEDSQLTGLTGQLAELDPGRHNGQDLGPVHNLDSTITAVQPSIPAPPISSGSDGASNENRQASSSPVVGDPFSQWGALESMQQSQEQLPGADLPTAYSLDSRKGYSSQLIGLSSECDPYLLRHYKYDGNDNYTMFRLDWRRVMDDGHARSSDTEPKRLTPSGYAPVQFIMSDEVIWKRDSEAVNEILCGTRSEFQDFELLGKLVPADLGSRLINL